MAKIRILPEQIANQIAAGEVVERPASVVKELLENSIDAGADSIEVDIEGGGTRLIRVIDNGEGMDEDDVLMSFERHGTSKIDRETGIDAVTSLGFRGEAIPSIASVAKLSITSRRAQDEFGTAAFSSFGSLKKVHETGARAGTIVEVKNLFGNTPARKKFLRTARTELAHIDETVRSYGLARPDISFTLRIDGRETISLDRKMEPAARLGAILKYGGPFIGIDAGPPGTDGIRVTGLLVPPDATAAVAGKLRLIVNDRVIRDRLLVHAVNEGLRSFLLKGRYPAGYVAVALPPGEVDVNVHPAKHEVRFKDGRTVHRRVADAVRAALVAAQQPLRRDLFSGGEANLHPPGPPSGMTRERPPPAAPEEHATPPSYRDYRPPAPVFATAEERPAPAPPPREATADAARARTEVRVEELVVIGCFKDLYIFCRNEDRLVVIDQHAAHERLLFEDLRRQYTAGAVAAQNLLFPVTLELTAKQAQLVEANLDRLEEMGFSLRDFGGTTWVLAAVPALAGTVNPQALFFDILEQFGSERDDRGDAVLDDILATMACKAAVKSGDALSDAEIRALLQRLADADLFSHCPHGRPVVKIFPAEEVKKWFYRT